MLRKYPRDTEDPDTMQKKEPNGTKTLPRYTQNRTPQLAENSTARPSACIMKGCNQFAERKKWKLLSKNTIDYSSFIF